MRITKTPMKGTSEKFYCTYTGLYDDVKVGDIILIDDGNLEMKVIEKDEKAQEIVVQAQNDHYIKDQKGMELLIYISLAVLACAWAFIIPNSWGAFGLLYATIEAASLFAAVLYVLGEFNGNSYFQVQEWLMSYQLGQYNAFMFS